MELRLQDIDGKRWMARGKNEEQDKRDITVGHDINNGIWLNNKAKSSCFCLILLHCLEIDSDESRVDLHISTRHILLVVQPI